MKEFPDDDSGTVLKRMYEGGDSLTQPRNIDYCFAFPSRQQSLDFAEAVDEREYEVCLSYYDEREMWQAIVKKHMVPDYDAIMHIVADLSARAERVGGEADGWGCMRIVEKS